MIVLVIFSISSYASPQSGGKSSGSGAAAGAYKGGDGSVARLVRESDVQAELHLSENQKVTVETTTKRLDALEAAIRQRMDSGPYTTLSGNGSLPALIEGANREHDRVVPKLLQTLTPPQRRRLLEIRLQVLDANALLLPEVIHILNLSTDQQRRLYTMKSQAIRSSIASNRGDRNAFRDEQRRLRRSQARTGTQSGQRGGISRNNPQQAAERLRQHKQLIKEAEQRMLNEVLTPKQRAKFHEIKGRPYNRKL